MNPIAALWQKSTFLFDPVQYLFNGNFWEVFKKNFGDYGEKNVIDIACGTADLINYISPKKYLGVDLNKAYISSNQQKFKSTNTKFLLADASKFRIPDEYDTAFLISALHHLSDKQIIDLCKNIKRSKIKTFIIVDGYPVGIFKGLLAWLDGFLAGGKYFRSKDEIAKIVSPYLTIQKKGEFYAKRSFYHYPYLITKNFQ